MVTVTERDRAAAVQVVWKTLADIIGPDRYRAEQVVDALARAGLPVVDSQRVAALEVVALIAEDVLTAAPERAHYARQALRNALDAVPAAKEVCNCPRNNLGMVNGNYGNCPEHPLPGCPNPACGETWIKAFHGDRCESCGWRAAPGPSPAEDAAFTELVQLGQEIERSGEA